MLIIMRHGNFNSLRGRIGKERGKEGEGEAGIENRGKGTPSPLSLNHFSSKVSKTYIL